MSEDAEMVPQDAGSERKSKSPEEVRAAARERKRRSRERSQGMSQETEVKCSRATTFDPEAPYEPPDTGDVEPIGVTMRKVIQQDRRDDKGHLQRQLRRMLDRDAKSYLQQMIAFEKEAAGQQAAESAVENREPEPNVERLLEMGRALLADLTRPKE